MAEDTELQVDSPPEGPSVQERAREMGWSPKEEFRGDQAKWIDAETYLKRGEELLPIVRAENRKLHREVTELRGELGQAKTTIQASQESIDELIRANSQQARDRAKERKSELTAAIVAARSEGNIEQEIALTEQLGEQTATLREAEAAATREPKKAELPVQHDFTQDPAWKAWHSENKWFGQDQERTDYAAYVGGQMRAQGTPLIGRAFLDAVVERVNRTLGDPQGGRRPVTKVESGRPNGHASGGKSFADLPADVQATANRQAQRLVGTGKRFPDAESWRKHYTKIYFEE